MPTGIFGRQNGVVVWCCRPALPITPIRLQATTAASYQSAHANLIYAPIAALNFGVEYIRATKNNERPVNSDDSGDVDRLQFSAKYTF